MNKWQVDVRDFHEKFDKPVRYTPTVLPPEEEELCMGLIYEEADEIDDALANQDMVALADGAADLIYVTLSMCVHAGIDLEEVWNRVQEANMAKVGGGKRDDGKILKPAGWTPPDVKGALELQGWKDDRTQNY